MNEQMDVLPLITRLKSLERVLDFKWQETHRPEDGTWSPVKRDNVAALFIRGFQPVYADDELHKLMTAEWLEFFRQFPESPYMNVVSIPSLYKVVRIVPKPEYKNLVTEVNDEVDRLVKRLEGIGCDVEINSRPKIPEEYMERVAMSERREAYIVLSVEKSSDLYHQLRATGLGKTISQYNKKRFISFHSMIQGTVKSLRSFRDTKKRF